MCRGQTVPVLVHIDADLACEGREKWKAAQVDSCIASLVRALQEGGINMRGSCCGHARGDGYISLSDGRILIVREDASGRWLADLNKKASERMASFSARLRAVLERDDNGGDQCLKPQ